MSRYDRPTEDHYIAFDDITLAWEKYNDLVENELELFSANMCPILDSTDYEVGKMWLVVWCVYTDNNTGEQA